MDLLQHMRTFVRIADSGNISRAARSLNLSVPMASRHLRALEEDLGVELLRRTTRSLALTDAGAEFLVRSRALLAGVEQAREVVRPGQGVAGRLVVSLPVSFGLAQVLPLFRALLDEHPRLELDLRFEDRIADLLVDGVDLAIRAGVAPPDSPALIARRLATVERVLCASPAFLAKKPALARVQDLARVSCVLQGDAGVRWTFVTDDGPVEIHVEGRLRINNVVAVRDAALGGFGVARLPLWIVDEDLRAKRLVRVLPEASMPRIEIYGLYHRGARSSGPVRATLDFLAAELPRRTRMERIHR